MLTLRAVEPMALWLVFSFRWYCLSLPLGRRLSHSFRLRKNTGEVCVVGGGGRSLRVVLSRSLGCEHLCLGGVCSGIAGVWWLSVLVHVGDACFSELRVSVRGPRGSCAVAHRERPSMGMSV